MFFRDILANAKHPEPFIFLSGAKKCELQNIVEFLYGGETNISNDDLKKYLEISQQLQIIGVENVSFDKSGDNLDMETNADDGRQKNILATDIGQLNATSSDAYLKDESYGGDSDEESESMDENIACTDDLHSKDIDHIIDLKELHGITKDLKEQVDVSEDTDEYIELTKKETPISAQLNSKNVNMEKLDPTMGVKDELNRETETLIEKVDGLWECKMCGKTSVKKDHAKRHTETHLTSISHPCTVCSKTLRTSESLRKHVQFVHSDESLTCSSCGKSGMNKTQFKNHKYLAKRAGKCT